MKELAKHIEILLLENDCVIVPGLGGFIVHNESAYYDSHEQIFYPPKRSIGFNPKLTINDGLLVQFYMQTYHMDFRDANRRIELEVSDLKDQLYKNGCVYLKGIGNLYCNIHNDFEFRTDEPNVMTPSLYSLPHFYMSPLSKVSTSESKTIEFRPKLSQSPEEKKKIQTPRWITDAVAVVAAILLFFIFSVPVENTYMDQGDYASLSSNDFIDVIKSQSLAMNVINPEIHKKASPTPAKETTKKEVKKVNIPMTSTNKVKEAVVKQPVAQPKEEKVIKEQPKTEVKTVTVQPTITTPAPKPTPNVSVPRYHIIIASLDTMRDAQATVTLMESKGLQNLKIKEGSGHFRIVHSSFVEKDVANNKLNELKQQEQFKNAWLLCSK